MQTCAYERLRVIYVPNREQQLCHRDGVDFVFPCELWPGLPFLTVLVILQPASRVTMEPDIKVR